MTEKTNLSLRRKRSARLAAIQGLYSRANSDVVLSADRLAAQLTSQWQDSIDAKDAEWPSTDMPENALLAELLGGVIEHESTIDERLRSVLKDNWKPERMDPVVRAILRCAIYELQHQDDRKEAVILDEYVTIASGFTDDKELGFVHSALQQIAQQIRPAS